jgi:two-component system, OmpR family, response regulator
VNGHWGAAGAPFAANGEEATAGDGSAAAYPYPEKGGAVTGFAETVDAPAFRVLVVDDNRDAADSLALLLGTWGFEVQAVYDGPEAMRAAYEYRPDCVLADIGLPGMDGYRLAEQVRREEAFRGMTLVAVTAYNEAARAKEAGFDHHILKPADPTSLKELLRGLRAMDKRLKRVEEAVQQHAAVAAETRSLMAEVKEGMQEMRQELRKVEEDVKHIKAELREAKENKGD